MADLTISSGGSTNFANNGGTSVPTGDYAINERNNAEVESVDLVTMPTSGTISKENIDFSKISNTAQGATNGNYVAVHQEYWGDNGELTYQIRDDGTVAIMENGTVLGFTTVDAIGGAMPQNGSQQTPTNVNTQDAAAISQQPVVEQPQQTVTQAEAQAAAEAQAQAEIQTQTAAAQAQVQAAAEAQAKALEQQAESMALNSMPFGEAAAALAGGGTVLKTVTIPSDIRQTGICPNYTNYSYFYDKWNSGTAQRNLANMWDAAGRPNSNGIATLNGRYLVAMSQMYGKVGDSVNVTLEDSTVIPCMIADAKGLDATSPYGHVLSGGVDVIEWESFASKDSIQLGDWRGKKVVTVDNLSSAA